MLYVNIIYITICVYHEDANIFMYSNFKNILNKTILVFFDKKKENDIKNEILLDILLICTLYCDPCHSVKLNGI